MGGARRFELIRPSIVDRILKVYNNSDLFLHSPLDANTYKFTLLKKAPRIAAVRIFQPQPIPETESQLRVLISQNSPNGIQLLLVVRIDRFAKFATPSGLLNGLNPGIINHVRNSKQVHSIIEALVRSERSENRYSGSKQDNQTKCSTKEFNDKEDLEKNKLFGN
ncbi:uncharacterized protein LOC111379221 [Olea europaea subsp. europaea]|uniref:Uncharacterized protein LOC111379221 n=1 Tax=Olea europaea subsp. europaea TaxID=158383 RepID=A0A8S0RS99_OLEEU|nr:uncharacterized protein LOC111379221 [Olea europaea subsp. europaea]